MAKLPFKHLIVWQKSMQLAKSTYAFTARLPHHEKFGLISQMRRAAVSIPSNIAEGSQRSSSKDFRHFLDIAKGSLAELETQLLLCADLEISQKESIDALIEKIDEVGRILYAFKNQLPQ